MASYTRMERIKAFSQFVNSESHTFIKFASHPGFVIQQAYNSAKSGPIASVAEDIINAGVKEVLLLRNPVWRPEYNSHPALIRSLAGHMGYVLSVVLTSDGRKAVSGGEDKTLRVWELETGKCLMILEGHKGGVNSVAITPDGRRAISGSDDKTLKVWDLNTGRCLNTIEGHTSFVESVSITPDGRRANSWSFDCTLKWWDVETGRCLNTVSHYDINRRQGAAFFPDSRTAVAVKGSTLKVLDIRNGWCYKILEGHTKFINSVSITPDGRRAISGSDDNTIRVWDLETGQCQKILVGHASQVDSVAITPDGRRAVSGSHDNTIRVWDLETGQCLKILVGHTSQVDSVAIAPDGRRAVSGSGYKVLLATGDEWGSYIDRDIRRLENGDNTLRVWDLEAGQCLKTIDMPLINSAALKPKNMRPVINWDDTLKELNLETGRCHQPPVGQNVAPPSDSRRMVMAAYTRLERIKAFSQFVNSESHTFIKFASHPGFVIQQAYNSAKSGPIASAAEDIINAGVNEVLLLRHPAQRPEYNPHPALIKTLEGHTGPIYSVSITQDGKRAVSGSSWKSFFSLSRDKALRVWDMESGQCLRILEGHTGPVYSVSITQDGKRAISAGSDTVRVWDMESGQCLRTLDANISTELSMTPDGKRAISGGSDRNLWIWDMENIQCLKIIEGHKQRVTSVNMTPDGKMAISASTDSTLRVRDMESGKGIKALKGHICEVESVSVTPDGKIAVSASKDKTLRVWDLKTSRCLKILKGHTHWVESVSVTPDGKRAISASHDKTLRVWDLTIGRCLAIYQTDGAALSVSGLTTSGRFVLGTSEGDVILFTPLSLPMETPIVTPVRMWQYGENKNKSCWEDHITTICLWCGQRFPVSDAILNAIKDINRKAGLTPDKSPCLELPNKAWENPRLLSECPLCHKPLKFNPFIVDNRDRY